MSSERFSFLQLLNQFRTADQTAKIDLIGAQVDGLYARITALENLAADLQAQLTALGDVVDEAVGDSANFDALIGTSPAFERLELALEELDARANRLDQAAQDATSLAQRAQTYAQRAESDLEVLLDAWDAKGT